MPTVLLFENANFGGRAHTVTADSGTLPPPLDGAASSLTTDHPGWTIFWESQNFDARDDSLWVEGARAQGDPNLKNLHTLPRPHGSKHWGDRIRGVSFSANGPDTNNDNRTIYRANGQITSG